MHISVTQKWFEKTFAEFDKNKNNQIEYEEFQQMMIKISMKKEVVSIFKEFCSRASSGLENVEENVMTPEELQKFFLKAQNEKLDLKKDIFPMIDSYNNNANKKEKDYELSFLNFCNILFSMKNEIFNQEKSKLFQVLLNFLKFFKNINLKDMNQPLTSYWINSSHNTFLLSHQLKGESSTQAYLNAFQKGCRCVELDCWDGEKGEPIIYHGHTLTTKIFFADVIQLIKDYAFVKNPYPVLLSIENHCSKKQQDRMAELFKSILGDLLYILPKDWEQKKFFPSPNELKKKVLVKDKANLSSKNENFNEELNENVNVEDVAEGHKFEVQCLTSLPQASYLKARSFEILKFESETKFDSEERNEKKFKKNYGYQVENLQEIENKIMKDVQNKIDSIEKKSKTIIKPLEVIPEKLSPQSERLASAKKNKKTKEKSQEFINCITIFGCKLLLGDPERLSWNMSSVSEEKVLKYLQNNEVEFIDHNKWTFSKVYPGGLRIDSSNFDPMPSFVTGCQAIALNIQTNDLNLQMYLSRFMVNGGINSGYVLKPDFMLYNSKEPKYPKDFTAPIFQVVIKIISGTQLKPMKKDESDIIDPFVELNLKGLPIEEKNNKVCRTAIVQNNGFNPQFGEVFTFDVYCPEIAILVFQVFDQDKLSNEKIGSFALPVNCIRNGYRVVPLRNTIDFKFIEHSFIFCHIEKKIL